MEPRCPKTVFLSSFFSLANPVLMHLEIVLTGETLEGLPTLNWGCRDPNNTVSGSTPHCIFWSEFLRCRRTLWWSCGPSSKVCCTPICEVVSGCSGCQSVRQLWPNTHSLGRYPPSLSHKSAHHHRHPPIVRWQYSWTFHVRHAVSQKKVDR